MKKLASLVLASAMAVVPFAAGLAATFTPGEYEATAQGFAGAVTVKVTVYTPGKWNCTGPGSLRFESGIPESEPKFHK